MPILKDVLARLSGEPSITSLVSTRIYANVLKQDVVYPALSYSVISRVHEHCFNSDPGNVRLRLQIDCWAKQYAEAMSVAIAVKNTLSRWRGQQTNYFVEDCLIDNWTDYFDDESNQRVHRISMDFILFFR